MRQMVLCVCRACGETFPAKRRDKDTCSEKCRQRYSRFLRGKGPCPEAVRMRQHVAASVDRTERDITQVRDYVKAEGEALKERTA